MTSEPHRVVERPKPKKERPLSDSQLRILHNLAVGAAANIHLYGRSQHGAFPQTISSLERRCLLVYRARPENARLTFAGLQAHLKECCKEGKSIDDHLVEQMELRLRGQPPEPLWIYHSGCQLMSPSSDFKVVCPACLVGVLMVQREPDSLKLSRHDNCFRCGQRFVYRDDTIAGERLGDFRREEDEEDEG